MTTILNQRLDLVLLKFRYGRKLEASLDESLFLFIKVTVAVGMLCQTVASCPRLLKSEITELMTPLVAQSKYDVRYSKNSVVYVCDVDFQILNETYCVLRVFKENSILDVGSSYFALISKSKFCFRSPFPEYWYEDLQVSSLWLNYPIRNF